MTRSWRRPRELGQRYRLEAELGRGGMGVVWAAHDERLERRVAIKVLHPWIAEDPEARARFAREARLLAKLSHENILRVFDYEEDAGEAFIVMELLEGTTLDEAVGARLPLSWEEARGILLPVCYGLAYAHRHEVVHRDLKPNNVMLVGERLVIADFGLARAAQGTQSITAAGMLLGSPEYWAPEQAAGEEVRSAADMYALGCILYELVAGRLPFEGEDRLAVGYRRVHELPRDLRDLRTDLPEVAYRLLGGLLSRSPSQRPSAGDVTRTLSSGDAPLPSLATITNPDGPATTTKLAPIPSRRRLPVLLAAAILPILGASGVAAVVWAERTSSTPLGANEAGDHATETSVPGVTTRSPTRSATNPADSQQGPSKGTKESTRPSAPPHGFRRLYGSWAEAQRLNERLVTNAVAINDALLRGVGEHGIRTVPPSVKREVEDLDKIAEDASKLSGKASAINTQLRRPADDVSLLAELIAKMAIDLKVAFWDTYRSSGGAPLTMGSGGFSPLYFSEIEAAIAEQMHVGTRVRAALEPTGEEFGYAKIPSVRGWQRIAYPEAASDWP